MAREQGLDLNIAWVSGDEVLGVVEEAIASNSSDFEHLCTGKKLAEWEYKPVYAQAYLGGLGIAAAFENGADIVLCGRVSDASLVIGAAAWWHGWQRTDLDQLANALIAGHIIECSSYVTGGNYTGFKALEGAGWENLGFPIAEIAQTGEVVITMTRDWAGEVSVHTCTAQILYEIQGPRYYNSDVTAIIDEVWFEQLDKNRVALRGVKADLPPPTTKIGLTARGLWQAELHWFMVGLDIDAKARMLEAQIRKELAPHVHRFTKLEFTKNGSVPENPTNQNSATVDFRIFAQAPTSADLSPRKFLRPCMDPIMQTFPGASPHMDFRQALPKEVYEYWVTLLPQLAISHKVHLHTGAELEIPPAAKTKEYPRQQPSQPATSNPVHPSRFGETVKAPLGWIVHARSGDKGSDANIGFWVRYADEYDWLRSLLSIDTIKVLLAEEYMGKPIVRTSKLLDQLTADIWQDRFELPKSHAVHFLLRDHLDRGLSVSSTYDFAGKNVAEFLRARHVDIPVQFLERGKI
ncbi:hypothetical protein BDV39DRAFT_168773 [Aspergillus sergii]|uniref:DUF1446-domain-containing protein n=1 Tax=Aspergillus sergii TaxID=1034303 RepID=A0A5N6XES4_9EURO|nr:hypothetical protein BDV39DRAFT_168773 [Aspergillus sergii]